MHVLRVVYMDDSMTQKKKKKKGARLQANTLTEVIINKYKSKQKPCMRLYGGGYNVNDKSDIRNESNK